MSQFSVLMMLGVVFIFLLFIFTYGWPEVCNNDTRQCPDNSFVERDPLNNCEFFDCPLNEFIGFCTDEVVRVEVSDNYVRAVVDDGFTVYDTDATDCPGTLECTNFSDLEWVLKVNCSLVNYSFSCPTDYEEIDGFKWITCEEPVPAKFTDYCGTWFSKWIAHNCPEINFI